MQIRSVVFLLLMVCTLFAKESEKFNVNDILYIKQSNNPSELRQERIDNITRQDQNITINGITFHVVTINFGKHSTLRIDYAPPITQTQGMINIDNKNQTLIYYQYRF
jgi:hypothetical protein